MAEYYSAELSVKISRGQTDNALKCKHNGGWVPLGYRVNSEQCYELDPLTAPIVREIFELYADGVSAKEIGEMLNKREIRTQNGHLFKKNSLTNMLSNRKYIGEYRYGSVVTPGGMPSLVSEELFERVQERLAKNKHAPARSKALENYLLTTKLYCGKCGAFMVGESGTSRTGQLYHYYKCVNTKKNKTCDKKTVKKDYIEDYVVYYILHAVLIDSTIERMADAMLAVQDNENTVLPALRNKLKEIEKIIENILNAIQQGIITASTKDRLLQLEADKEEVQIAIAQEEIEKPHFSKEEMICWISMFRGGDPTDQKYRQRLIDTFVNAIYLYDDKIVLITNYKDGTKTVTLEQVEEALSSWEPTGSDIKNCFPPNKTDHFDTKVSEWSVFIFSFFRIYDTIN